MSPVIIGKATIYNADCMELLKATPDKFYDLAIVDPPYGINVAKSGVVGGGGVAKPTNYGAKDWDKNAPNQDYFEELIRVSKNQIIWGANYMTTYLQPSMGWVVWDKDNGTTKFSDCELAYTSFETALRKFKYTWNGMIQGDMKNKETRIHPTQKPIKLYEWLLTNYAKQGDKILDTHGGSMSSVIACLNLGFEVVCTELDSDYFQAGIKRVEQSQKQQRMFE